MFKLLSTVLNLDADFPELIITSNDITQYLLHILNYLLYSYLVQINVINGSYWMWKLSAQKMSWVTFKLKGNLTSSWVSCSSSILNLNDNFPELIITHYLLHILNYLLSSYLVKINVINVSYWMWKLWAVYKIPIMGFGGYRRVSKMTVNHIHLRFWTRVSEIDRIWTSAYYINTE